MHAIELDRDQGAGTVRLIGDADALFDKHCENLIDGEALAVRFERDAEQSELITVTSSAKLVAAGKVLPADHGLLDDHHRIGRERHSQDLLQAANASAQLASQRATPIAIREQDFDVHVAMVRVKYAQAAVQAIENETPQGADPYECAQNARSERCTDGGTSNP